MAPFNVNWIQRTTSGTSLFTVSDCKCSLVLVMCAFLIVCMFTRMPNCFVLRHRFFIHFSVYWWGLRYLVILARWSTVITFVLRVIVLCLCLLIMGSRPNVRTVQHTSAGGFYFSVSSWGLLRVRMDRLVRR